MGLWASYLRLVVSRDSPAFLHFGTGDLLQRTPDDESAGSAPR